MSRITLLDKHVAELIAAGEVVERPASVIKELVENAIDAGATSVSVEIEHGGVLLMKVSDNGSGIAREDVAKAFLRHATSKITSGEDLEQIATLGFRGEALASICAVARVELITRTSDELAGTRYVIEGGEEAFIEDVGCPVGTTIIVRDVFYNTPARMKFLKKDVSEGNAVMAVLERVAMSHPEVAVKGIRDSKVSVNTPGDGKLLSAVYAVSGREFAASLIPIEYGQGGLSVHGYICQPVSCRATRNLQFFFINGRLIRSKTVMAALEQAYKNSAMVGKFPACVLHLTIPYGAIDVNVHPAKTEVRFSDERRVFDCVYYGVKTTLAGGDLRPHMSLNQAESGRKADFGPITAYQQQKLVVNDLPLADSVQTTEDSSFGYKLSTPHKNADETVKLNNYDNRLYNTGINKEGYYKESGKPGFSLDIVVDDEPALSQNEESVSMQSNNKNIENSIAEPSLETVIRDVNSNVSNETAADIVESSVTADNISMRILGEAFTTYIVVEQGDELVLLDKHAAHERILFEELKQNAEVREQLLLVPVSVPLSRDEYGAILDNSEILKEAGYEVEDFGDNLILVRSVPLSLNGENVKDLIEELAGGFLDQKEKAVPHRLDWLYHSIACRAAVKAGDHSSLMELEHLAERVLSSNDIMYCPHGRPVAIRLSKKEIEKQFGRIQ